MTTTDDDVSKEMENKKEINLCVKRKRFIHAIMRDGLGHAVVMLYLSLVDTM